MWRCLRQPPGPMLSPPDGLLDSSRPCNSVFIAQADMGSSVQFLRLKVIGELMDQGINQLRGLAFGGRPRRRMDLSRSPSSIRSGLAARTQLLTWRCTAGQTTEGLEERNLWLSNSWLLRHRCSIVASTLRWVLSRACTALPVRSSECS